VANLRNEAIARVVPSVRRAYARSLVVPMRDVARMERTKRGEETENLSLSLSLSLSFSLSPSLSLSLGRARLVALIVGALGPPRAELTAPEIRSGVHAHSRAHYAHGRERAASKAPYHPQSLAKTCLRLSQ